MLYMNTCLYNGSWKKGFFRIFLRHFQNIYSLLVTSSTCTFSRETVSWFLLAVSSATWNIFITYNNYRRFQQFSGLFSMAFSIWNSRYLVWNFQSQTFTSTGSSFVSCSRFLQYSRPKSNNFRITRIHIPIPNPFTVPKNRTNINMRHHVEKSIFEDFQ